MYEPGFFAFADQLKAISKSGDPLELIEQHVDFEVFRPTLEAALDRGDRPGTSKTPFFTKILIFNSTV